MHSLCRLLTALAPAAACVAWSSAMDMPDQEFPQQGAHCTTLMGHVASVSPPGTITLAKPMHVEVRALGMGVTECRARKRAKEIFAETRISINGADYSQLFYGTQHDVDPSLLLYAKRHAKGTTIDFGGRYVKGGAWAPFFTTRNDNAQVIALANGDVIPTSFNLATSGKMAPYLKRVVDETGKVKIGPMSLLILAEYAATDHSKECFDYQDMVLLVTFSEQIEDDGPK